MDRDDPAYRGQSDYTRLLLRLYDPLVLGPIGRFVWRCPTARLLAGYREHIRDRGGGPVAWGVLFGASVLGTAGPQTWLSRWILAAFNRRGAFDNLEDTEEGLGEILAASFASGQFETVGSIAIFAATNPRARARLIARIGRNHCCGRSWTPFSSLARRSILDAGLCGGVHVLRRQKDHGFHAGRS